MKHKLVNICVIFLLLFCLSTPIPFAASAQETLNTVNDNHAVFDLQAEHGDGEIILQMNSTHDGASVSVQSISADINGLCSAFQLENLDDNTQVSSVHGVQVQSLSVKTQNLYLVKTYGDLAATLTSLNEPTIKATYGIKYAQPNYLYKPSVIFNDPRYKDQRATQNAMFIAQGLDVGVTTDVVFANLDTGISASHEDLMGNIIPGGWDFVNNSPDLTERDALHGSLTAGMGAVSNNGVGISGIAGSVPILPLKISTADGRISTFAAIKAMDYTVWLLNGKKAVFNASWAGPGVNPALDVAINRVGQAGFLFVAAAGNYSNNNDIIPYHPSSSSSPYVISVGAFDSSLEEFAYFSNYGQSVDIAAPGVDILTTWPGNNYEVVSGTSIACPQVTVAAALIMGRINPVTGQNFTALETKEILLRSATRLPELTGKVATGLLNLRDAMALTRPETDANAGSPVTITKGESVQFFGNGNHETCTWDFGDNKSSDEQNPLHKFKKVGYYTVTQTVSDGGRTSSSTTVVKVTDVVTILRAVSKKNGSKYTVTATSTKADLTNPTQMLTLILINAETGKVVTLHSYADSIEAGAYVFSNNTSGSYFPEIAKAKVISAFGGKAETLFVQK